MPTEHFVRSGRTTATSESSRRARDGIDSRPVHATEISIDLREEAGLALDLLAFTDFLPRITRPARAALGKALFIAGCQFALYLGVASRIGGTRLPLTVDFPTFYYAALVYRAGGNPYDLSLLGKWAKSIGTDVYPLTYPPPSLPAFYPLGLAEIHASQLGFQL